MITAINEIAKTLNYGEQLDVSLLEFRKAFDKVNHCNLYLKIQHYGLRGERLNWLKDYIDRRMQRVVAESKMSDLVHVKSEVPHATVFTPHFYISDLPNTVKCKFGLFNDNSIVCNRIPSLNSCELLLKDLDSSTTWSKMCDMEINTNKCKIILIIVAYPYQLIYHPCKLYQQPPEFTTAFGKCRRSAVEAFFLRRQTFAVVIILISL